MPFATTKAKFLSSLANSTMGNGIEFEDYNGSYLRSASSFFKHIEELRTSKSDITEAARKTNQDSHKA